MTLDALRGRLDVLDDELIDVLARRAAVVDTIWQWKQAHGVERIDPTREAQMKQRLTALATARGLNPDAVAAVFAQIIGRPLR